MTAELPGTLQAHPGAMWWVSTWAKNQTKGKFTSKPFQSETGWMEFWYLGKTSENGLSLSLKPVKNGKRIKLVVGDRHGTSLWQRFLVEVDTEKPYVLEFKDSRKGGWGAVTAPYSVGRLSVFTERVFSHSLAGVTVSGLCLSLLLVFVPCRKPAENNHPSSNIP